MSVKPHPAPHNHPVIKRSVVISGHKTSVSLEQPFYDALKEIAAARGMTFGALAAEIDLQHGYNLSSALRCYALDFFKRRACKIEG